MKKSTKIILAILIIIIMVIGSMFLIDLNRMKNNKPVLFSTWGRKYAPPATINVSTILGIVTSLEDEIEPNTAWCGTFNLIWNDLKNDLAKKDIIFNPQLTVVDNLNKGTFNTSYLSEDSYYKVYGTPTLELKKQIEKAIKEKFNETSSILDDFNWEGGQDGDYFLYVMLKKQFEFPKVFTTLENGQFGNYKNVKYFGIDSTTDKAVRDQVEVLYYDSTSDFAVKLKTKQNDEVIISRGNTENNFGEIYKGIVEKSNKYEGSRTFNELDKLKIPKISFNLKEEIKEVENKTFTYSNGEEHYIETALQTIEFELDEKGGRIKSEAGMMDKLNSAMPEEPRNFYVDDTFTIFLKEEGKDLPYFAAQISDISQVQDEIR